MTGPCIINVTYNFTIPNDIKKKIHDRFTYILEQYKLGPYKCMLQFNQKHEDDLYLYGTNDKVLFIRFEYSSGLTSDKQCIEWMNGIKDIIQIDLSISFERVIILKPDLDIVRFLSI